MSFLHPAIFLAGLACIAIPIAIHLLMRRRRRPVPWAAMKFLMEAYRKQRRRLTLEQLLLLALRCLLVAFIGVALARPIIGAAAGLTGPGPRTVYLVIDNSLASGLRDDAGRTALERHQARAREILSGLDAERGDRAALVLLGSPAEAVVSPPAVDLAAVESAVRTAEPTDGPADWTGFAAVVRSAISARRPDEPAASVIILSELRAGSIDLRRPAPKLGLEGGAALLVAHPAVEPADNITVMDVEPVRGVLLRREGGAASAGDPVRVVLRRSGPGVSRTGITEVRVSVDAASGDAGQPGTGQVRWASGQEEATLTIPMPAQHSAPGTSGRVLSARVDNDALSGDNVWRRPVHLGDAVEVALISPPLGVAAGIDQYTPTDWYRLALNPEGDQPGGQVRTTVIESSQAGIRPLDLFDAVILPYPESLDEGAWRALGQFTRSGGAVILNPTPSEGLNTWTDDMARSLGLSWEIGREAEQLGEPAIVQPGREGGADGLLGLLGGELEELLKSVRIRRLLSIDPRDVSARVELRAAGGRPFLVVGEPAGGRGIVAMLAAAPDLAWTDLPVRPLMVPLIQELVRQGAGRAGGAWHGPAGSTVTAPAGAVEIRGPDDLVIPVASGQSAEAVRRAGVWRALEAGGAELGLIAVNADPEAARPDLQTEAELAPWLTTLAGEAGWAWLDESTPGRVGPTTPSAAMNVPPSGSATSLSLWLLYGAVGLALAELTLARWSSHAAGRKDIAP